MAGIPSEFIDQLLDRVDIVDIISPRVTLKKAGKDYQALCPFHTENTPSFTVSPNKQFYHCFGCGKHGTAIGFMMEFEGMEFVDSIETLAQMAGLEVPNQGSYQHSKKSKNLYEIVENANRYFVNEFNQSEFAKEYIQNRGISAETYQVFQVGFAPERWDGLIKYMPSTPQNDLIQAGLLAQNDSGKIYDKFRGRLMFPIQDKRGRVIAFGGRAVMPDQKPKYLNSPETPLFHKGKELYGLNIARKHSKDKSIIVVEGYMDVIALHQAGIKNSVATLGTATSEYHIITLLRSYEEIVFCFDGDKAGIQAAWKALVISLPVYRDDKNIRFLFLPDSHDPDTYVKEFGQEAFQKQIVDATSLSQSLLNKLKENIDLNSIDGRAKFIDKSKTYINELPKGQFRKLLLEEVSSLTKTKVDFILKPKAQNIQSIDQWNPIRKAIAILVNQPHLVINFPKEMALGDIQQNGANILQEIVEFCHQSPHVSSAVLIENFREHQAFAHLSALTTVSLDLNEEQMHLELKDIKKHFEKTIQKHKIARLREKKRKRH
ncbi:MAG: DNA primase [Proteobacteria bacterium]|nr:DNA primase [Pseudomonadota bacterium]